MERCPRKRRARIGEVRMRPYIGSRLIDIIRLSLKDSPGVGVRRRCGRAGVFLIPQRVVLHLQRIGLLKCIDLMIQDSDQV